MKGYAGDYSLFNWRCCIKDEVKSYLQQLSLKEIPNHRVRATSFQGLWGGCPSVALEAYSSQAYWYQDKPMHESAVSLVYSMHPNGQLVVLLYPHKSDGGSIVQDHFIIDFLESANMLAGECGRARIGKHYKDFLLMCNVSQVAFPPCRMSEKFLNKLRKRNEKFVSLHESDKDAKKAAIDTDIMFGAGLMGGLIASTIFPLFKDLGIEFKTKAAEIAKACRSEEIVDLSICLSGRQYELTKFIGDMLSTGWLLSAAIVLMIYTTYKIRKYLSS